MRLCLGQGITLNFSRNVLLARVFSDLNPRGLRRSVKKIIFLYHLLWFECYKFLTGPTVQTVGPQLVALFWKTVRPFRDRASWRRQEGRGGLGSL